MTAPPVPDTLSLFNDPNEVVFSSKVNLTGELSSKKAGVDVVVMAKPCGKATATKAATVQTTAGGEFSTDLGRPGTRSTRCRSERRSARNERQGGAAAAARPVAAHRYSLRVFAAQSFAGKWATFQRLKGNRWISVKRVRLQKNSTNILPTVISSVPFRWNSKTRPRVRAILPQGQAAAATSRASVTTSAARPTRWITDARAASTEVAHARPGPARWRCPLVNRIQAGLE